MVFDQIEQLKQQYTDKYVVVDDTRPELKRFKGQTGMIKTVNMSGRALVEFDAFANIGWYDIELDFLRVIDKPLPKPEKPAKKAAAKPAAKKEAAPAKKSGGGMSVEEMLAAARGEKAGGAALAKPATPKAEAKPAAAQPAAKKAGAMSVEEMLAAARAEKSGGGAAAAAAPAPAADPTPEPAAAPEPVAEAPAESSSAPSGPLPTAVADIVEYCRKADG